MNDRHEETVDRILQQLQQAEPPQGMEVRILNRLHAAGQKPVRPLGWWYAGGLAAFATLLLALAVREFRAFPAAAPVATVQPLKPHLDARPIAGPAPRPYASDIAKAPGMEARLGHLSKGLAARPRAVRAQAALQSFPAPAEPLTEQEKLLQRVARRGDQEDFDLLNPESVELAMVREKADFDEFLLTARKR